MSLIVEETGHINLVEAKENTSNKKGCLGTLEGPAADYGAPTRNNNFYSRKLWENTFKSKWVKEALANNVLIGEVDHPADRLEPRFQEAAIVLTDYSFDDKKQLLNAKFDILDTPKGRILKSLADYGCKIGISSRGNGTKVKKNGVNVIDEDTYVFGGFDAVVLPAVKSARQNYKEDTGLVSVDIMSNILKQIKECKSSSQLSDIKNILESANVDSDELAEALKSRESELQTSKDSNDSTTIINGLQRDLKEAYAQITKLSGNTSATSDDNGEYSGNEGLEELVDSLTTENAELDKQLTESENLVDKLKEQVENLESKLESANEIAEKQKKLHSESIINASKVKSLEESLSKATSELERRDSRIEAYKRKASRTNESLMSLKDDKESLEAELDNFREAYAKVVSSQYGLNYRAIKSTIDGMSLDEVDDYLATESVSLVRRNRLAPRRRKSRISEAESVTVVSESLESSELNATEALLESLRNNNNN